MKNKNTSNLKLSPPIPRYFAPTLFSKNQAWEVHSSMLVLKNSFVKIIKIDLCRRSTVHLMQQSKSTSIFLVFSLERSQPSIRFNRPICIVPSLSISMFMVITCKQPVKQFAAQMAIVQLPSAFHCPIKQAQFVQMMRTPTLALHIIHG